MLLGLVLGLAIYNRVLLDFPLPLALYKKLLQQVIALIWLVAWERVCVCMRGCMRGSAEGHAFCSFVRTQASR